MIIRINLPRVTTNRSRHSDDTCKWQDTISDFRKKHSFDQHDWCKYVRFAQAEFQHDQRQIAGQTDVEFTSLKTFGSNVYNTACDNGSTAAMSQEPINENNFKRAPAVKPRLSQPLITEHLAASGTPAAGCGYPLFDDDIRRADKEFRSPETDLPCSNLAASKSLFIQDLGRICQRFYPRP